ncbi:YeeE/YedE family protein [Peribacillus cavernae]|uniref:YeeE/YedE family protein n=1 Tax=Peribacillus cavernae TaxID=1674310 RepID=A0A433HBT6_9BACI|nr:YeeE/YedE family protein [Peribacillus cavernae]MDQ0219578.1 putative membrane protein YedE/YeeE [Peribacillus cavernae]RUQ25870.1 YeeE/YedE family protein [Peribacillus cavernae]
MAQTTLNTATQWNQKSTTVVTELSPMQKPLVTVGILAAIILFIVIGNVANWTQGVLFIIGLALGATLLHARFGFTSAFRRLMSVGNVQGLQAHMLMLAIATTLFALILSSGFSFTGIKPAGYVSPVGVSVLFGAFIFGIGMQLGNGCASGTLYSVGGGSSSMILTLLAFIAGSVLGAKHFTFWMEDTPTLPPISLAESTGLGYFGAWLVQMAVFAAIYWITVQIAKKKNPPMMKPLPTTRGWKKVIRGSWPLFAAAIILAILNALTLTIRGNPWGITSAFSLWGGKALMAMGVDVSSWGYFSGANGAALTQTVLADSTSVMNFGIILGAFISAAAQGTFKPKRIKPGVAGASIIGGILMGYGARLAFGCNIGAYFGGIASFSLHGWVWMVMAMLGTLLALFIRPLFGLKNPKPTDSIC